MRSTFISKNQWHNETVLKGFWHFYEIYSFEFCILYQAKTSGSWFAFKCIWSHKAHTFSAGVFMIYIHYEHIDLHPWCRFWLYTCIHVSILRKINFWLLFFSIITILEGIFTIVSVLKIIFKEVVRFHFRIVSAFWFEWNEVRTDTDERRFHYKLVAAGGIWKYVVEIKFIFNMRWIVFDCMENWSV